MRQIRTTDLDMVDEIAYRELGDHHLSQELYAVNPHLSSYDVLLPAGLLVNIPEISQAQKPIVSLWS